MLLGGDQSGNQENVYDISPRLDGALGSRYRRHGHSQHGETVDHRAPARGQLDRSNFKKSCKSESLQQCGEGNFERSPQE